MSWQRPDWRTLPETGMDSIRWVGSTIMDEEQYRTERWERRTILGVDVARDGIMTQRRVDQWRASPAGLDAYAALRKQRRADRKARWREREEQEQAYTDWVNSQLDAKGSA